jgi:hypothetical protein
VAYGAVALSAIDQVIADSGCNAGIFGNASLLERIHDCEPVRVHGIKGAVQVTQRGYWGNFAVNLDGRGRSGVIITMAGGAVCFKSNKQTLVAQSSTKVELIALTEGINQLVSLRRILDELGLPIKTPSVVYQDNKLTVNRAY